MFFKGFRQGKDDRQPDGIIYECILESDVCTFAAILEHSDVS